MTVEHAHNARRLAGVLSDDTGISVTVEYRQAVRRYAVVWRGGPDIAGMQEAVLRHIDRIGSLAAEVLLWDHRCDPMAIANAGLTFDETAED